MSPVHSASRTSGPFVARGRFPQAEADNSSTPHCLRHPLGQLSDGILLTRDVAARHSKGLWSSASRSTRAFAPTSRAAIRGSCSQSPAGGRPVSAVAAALGVSRPHLSSRQRTAPRRRRGRPPLPDAGLVAAAVTRTPGDTFGSCMISPSVSIALGVSAIAASRTSAGTFGRPDGFRAWPGCTGLRLARLFG
jgi:hypothetical protein